MTRLLAAVLLGVAAIQAHAVETVDQVDLRRYLGTWYELAKLPNRFQSDCQGNTTAHYSMQENGRIKVVNRCLKADGQPKKAVGEAKVVDSATNAKLKVSFVDLFGWNLFWGDYWIIGLGEAYQWAVIGHPERKFGWVLSRTPALPKENWDRIYRILQKNGYDIIEFEKTLQTGEGHRESSD